MSVGGSGRLHFVMPTGLDTFSRFKDLPYDIRYKIWEQIIYTPGIHFLKFERNAVSRPFTADGDDDDAPSTDDEHEPSGTQASLRSATRNAIVPTNKRYSASLKSVFPLPAADLSYYVTKSKTLAQLSFSCNEAASEVARVTSLPDNLTLDNGRLITTARSSDIVCIDYPDLLYTRGLSSWAKNLDTSQLSKIRRLAVRYHPSWDEERRLCLVCGRYHEMYPGARKEQAPRRHLYEFVALFPNLETFYFIDHLIVRRPFLSDDEHADPRWLGPSDRARVMTELSASKGRAERFESGGRTYFEINRQLCKVCKVHSHVFNMLEWVQENYIALCKAKGPSKHRSPKDVRFAVLASEWDEGKLVADKKHHVVVPKKRRSKNSRRVFRHDPELLEAMNSLKLESTYRDFTRPLCCPVVFGDEGMSAYEFTFCVK